MPAEQCSTLTDVVRELPDPRARRGRRYDWGTLVLLVVAAVASGQPTGAAIAQWVREHAAEWQQWRPTRHGRIPSAATLRRTLQRLDAPTLERRLSAWAAQQLQADDARQAREAAREREAAGAPPIQPAKEAAPLRGLAVDGKAVRGAQRHGARVHLVSLVTHTPTLVLGQQAVDHKSNEIPAVQALLRGRDLHGWLVTLDAMHTQVKTARLILAQGGHYLMVVKDNQRSLFAALSAWFAEPAWDAERAGTLQCQEKGHGRLERRTLTRRVLDPRLRLWPGARQALRRTCWTRVLATGQVREATTYALTSLPPIDATHAARATTAELARVEALWRGLWRIENSLHWVRDVTYHEDAGQGALGAAPQALAAFRNAVLTRLRCQGWTNMAAAGRHLAASVATVFDFLGCPRLVT